MAQKPANLIYGLEDKPSLMKARFDEFNLDVALSYQGVTLTVYT